MDDNTIIELFFARSEQAIRELDSQYGKTFHKLSYNILNSCQDAEECVNDAYLGTWNAIPPARPSPLLAFVCKIVRNLSLTRYHSGRAAKRGGGSYTASLEELQDFLETLPAENRVILMRRYWFSDSCGEIAARTGLSEKNVSVRLARIRKQLRYYLQEREVLL